MCLLTVGRGQKRPQGELVELDDDDLTSSLDRVLSQHTGIEAWWSGGIFADNRRSIDRWLKQQIIGVDIDHSDALGQHAELSDEARQALLGALPAAPCALAHLTPRGARLIVALDAPIVDRLAYPRVWKSITDAIVPWIPKLTIGSLALDVACRDLARYFWSPRATVGGVVRG